MFSDTCLEMEGLEISFMLLQNTFFLQICKI